MAKRTLSNQALKKRIDKWLQEDPASLVSKSMEKAVAPLQGLVALLLPERLIQEALEKTLWVAEAVTDRDDVLTALAAGSLSDAKLCKIERCDSVADGIHNWAIGTAAALGAWDLAGPLGTAASLVSLFTVALRLIKKVGLCYGFDTSKADEEVVVLQIFAAATGLTRTDKEQALNALKKDEFGDEVGREAVHAVLEKVARQVAVSLARRRALANIPVLGAIVGGSTNAWLIRDIGWAARNLYAWRRLNSVVVDDTEQGGGVVPVAQAA